RAGGCGIDAGLDEGLELDGVGLDGTDRDLVGAGAEDGVDGTGGRAGEGHQAEAPVAGGVVVGRAGGGGRGGVVGRGDLGGAGVARVVDGDDADAEARVVVGGGDGGEVEVDAEVGGAD